MGRRSSSASSGRTQAPIGRTISKAGRYQPTHPSAPSILQQETARNETPSSGTLSNSHPTLIPRTRISIGRPSKWVKFATGWEPPIRSTPTGARFPSSKSQAPDGTTEGEIVWYDYVGKPTGLTDERGTEIL